MNMTTKLGWALVVAGALALFASAAPAAVADSGNWTSVRILDCGAGGTITTLLNPAGFGTPYHDQDSGRVLVPLRIVVNGATVVDKPGVHNNALSEITCAYTDPAGRYVVVTGILTPPARE